MTGTSSGTASTIDLNKQSEPHSYSQSSTYISYQPKSSSYQPQNYSSSSYSTTQVLHVHSNDFCWVLLNNCVFKLQTTSSYVSNQPNNYVSNNSGSTYNTPSGTNAYQNAYSSSNSYQSNTASAGFPPSMSQANSYPGTNQAYPQNTSQSVYGTNAGKKFYTTSLCTSCLFLMLNFNRQIRFI